MDQKEEEERRMPPLVSGLLAVAALGTAFGLWYHSSGDEAKLDEQVRSAIYTTYSIGNPYSLALGNLRVSGQDPKVTCGRVNFERANNGGWSGFTDFFLRDSVIFLAPPAGQYEQTYRQLCVAPVPLSKSLP